MNQPSQPTLPHGGGSDFDFHQVRFEKAIHRGKAGYEVAQVVREMLADLIFVGATGRKGLSHLLVGGVARRLPRELPCSIITIVSQQPIRLSIQYGPAPADATSCVSRRLRQQCERFEHGEELLARGVVRAYTRLDQHEKDRWCQARAEEALRRRGYHRIEEESCGKYTPYRRIFGV